jgi:hypothetical protein
MISTISALVSPSMFMSRSLCEAYSLINGPRFGDNAMAESFHDLGYHQPDEGFIFQQEYGRTICHSSSDE